MFKTKVPTVILSGGQSRRMDRNDKAFLSFSNQTLLEIVVDRLKRQTQQVAINTNSNSPKYAQHGLPILKDQIGDFFGPLAGIFTAMKWIRHLLNSTLKIRWRTEQVRRRWWTSSTRA